LEDTSTLSNTQSLIAPVPSDITTNLFKKSLSGDNRQTPLMLVKVKEQREQAHNVRERQRSRRKN